MYILLLNKFENKFDYFSDEKFESPYRGIEYINLITY